MTVGEDESDGAAEEEAAERASVQPESRLRYIASVQPECRPRDIASVQPESRHRDIASVQPESRPSSPVSSTGREETYRVPGPSRVPGEQENAPEWPKRQLQDQTAAEARPEQRLTKVQTQDK